MTTKQWSVVALGALTVVLAASWFWTPTVFDDDAVPFEAELGRPIVAGWSGEAAPEGFKELFYELNAPDVAFRENPIVDSFWDVDAVVLFFDTWDDARSQTSHPFYDTILEQTQGEDPKGSMLFWSVPVTNNATNEQKSIRVVAFNATGLEQVPIECQALSAFDTIRWMPTDTLNLNGLEKIVARASKCVARAAHGRT